jgi:hypothetical protein
VRYTVRLGAWTEPDVLLIELHDQPHRPVVHLRLPNAINGVDAWPPCADLVMHSPDRIADEMRGDVELPDGRMLSAAARA